VNTLRVCVVTGTRAEYGLLRPVMRALREAPRYELQVIATGTHLAPEFGRTVDVIEADGITVDERVEMLLASDTAVGVTKSLGLATIGFADSLARLQPDLVVLLGDRYELLAAAQAALVARIPVAHLSGGDITEGAIDDAIRHAVTKLSHLHFVTNEDAARRVRQLGEDPSTIIVAGNPGLDDLLRWEPLAREELAEQLGLRLRSTNLLVTYHPATLAEEPAGSTFAELTAALDALGEDIGIILTLPNADPEGHVLTEMIRDFAEERPHVVAHRSLGQERYWSCLQHADAVVGNSSSGLIEAPAVGTPSVNIGDRQRGRLRATTTLDCPPERDAILRAIREVLSWRDVPASSPYGDGHATERILRSLDRIADPRDLLAKRFHALRGDG
jgi:UDP-hydrolysing UDP-N-acetyl-D-glucosamine 2-epimerase